MGVPVVGAGLNGDGESWSVEVPVRPKTGTPLGELVARGQPDGVDPPPKDGPPAPKYARELSIPAQGGGRCTHRPGGVIAPQFQRANPDRSPDAFIIILLAPFTCKESHRRPHSSSIWRGIRQTLNDAILKLSMPVQLTVPPTVSPFTMFTFLPPGTASPWFASNRCSAGCSARWDEYPAWKNRRAWSR